MSTFTHNRIRDAAPRGASARGRDLPHSPDPSTTHVGLQEGPRIYRGRTVDEVIPAIVAELGEDALVVRHHRGLTGGFAGFFQRPFVEIEARRGDAGQLLDRYDEDDAAPALPGPFDPFAAALAEAEAAVRAAEPAVPPHLDAALAAALAEAEAEAEAAEPMDELTISPADDFGSADTTSFVQVEPTDPPPPAAAAAGGGHAEDPAERALLERTLLAVGFDEQFVGEVLDTAAAHLLPLIESPSQSAFAQAVRRALQQRIPACPPLPSGPATIALVGPGGSGKSACCATLLDAYQRRSTLPATSAALTPTTDGAEQALLSAREEGLLLLDTPPLSPADPASIGALAAALERLAPDRVVLALPATLGAKPAARLLEAYRPLGTGAIALTHIDETDQLGVAVQAACALGLPPAYLLQGEGSSWMFTQVDPAGLIERLLPER
jgi:flagellar biosynthesis protein FlhF